MPKETFWGNVSFTAKSHGYLLAGVKSDLLDVYKNPDKYRKLYIDGKTGKKIDFKDIPCQEYRLFFKNDALQPFTANTFGPFFRSIRDKIGENVMKRRRLCHSSSILHFLIFDLYVVFVHI